MNTFFTSDTHWGHNNILKFCPDRQKRWPAAVLPPKMVDGKLVEQFDIEVMNEGLIERWNKTVSAIDKVYHLGDFAFCNAAKTKSILSRLHGEIHFTSGNHDKVVHENKDIRDMFASVRDYREMTFDKQKFVLFHFPIEIWNKGHHGAIHLHGHCHDSLPPTGRRVDVGVDSTGITGVAEHRPWALEEIVHCMKNRVYVPKDHHTGERM